MFKQHPKKFTLLAITMIASIYLFWPGFSVAPPSSSPAIIYIEQFGDESGSVSNVIGFEPILSPQDFASADHLIAKLSLYFDAAGDNSLIKENTVVLMPGHIGTALLASGQKSRVYNASSINAALPILISYNLVDFTKNYFVFDAPEKMYASVVRSQSRQAAAVLQDVFSSLARRYKTTIIAGSGLMMTPGIYPDGLTYGHGPIFHTSFVFGPDGKPMIDAVRQVGPSTDEMLVAKKSLAEFLPTFKLGPMQFGVAIGADASRDDVKSAYKAAGASILLSPQFHQHSFSTSTAMANAQEFDWGMAVSMKGQGWGFSPSSRASIIVDGDVIGIENADTDGRIYNLWIQPEK